jgi:hypothetical protein
MTTMPAATMVPPALRLAGVDDLATPEGLMPVLGPVAAVSGTPIATPGKSGSALHRLEVALQTGERRQLVLKRTLLGVDLVGRRTGDTVGREAALLGEPGLVGVWECVRSAYLAYAAAPGEIGLLMDDLGPYLVPDEETPITEAQEDALLDALARLHARYWEAPILGRSWLGTPAATFDVLSPAAAEEELRAGPSVLFEWVRQGWAALLARVPPPVARLLVEPTAAFAQIADGLPRTLLHGDTRLVNAAFLPGGTVALFDWQFVGTGPAPVDVAWYLIGNPRRRARAHEDILARYRASLEVALGRRLPPDLWSRLVDASVLFAAAVHLWDRTLDLEDNLPGATGEWHWWVDRLHDLSRRT